MRECVDFQLSVLNELSSCEDFQLSVLNALSAYADLSLFAFNGICFCMKGRWQIHGNIKIKIPEGFLLRGWYASTDVKQLHGLAGSFWFGSSRIFRFSDFFPAL